MRGRWAGYVARMYSTRWAKKASEWTPREGTRGRGTLKRRWRDNIEEVGSIQWIKVARD